jgi:hypothetical protein
MAWTLFLRHSLQSAAAAVVRVAAASTALQAAAAAVVVVVTPLMELRSQVQGQQIKEIPAVQAIAQRLWRPTKQAAGAVVQAWPEQMQPQALEVMAVQGCFLPSQAHQLREAAVVVAVKEPPLALQVLAVLVVVGMGRKMAWAYQPGNPTLAAEAVVRAVLVVWRGQQEAPVSSSFAIKDKE